MLEFKEVNINQGEELLASDLSFVVNSGEVVGLAGSTVSARDTLLGSVVGLQSVSSGYVSIDCELIASGSAQFFRQMMSYLPRDLRLPYSTIAEMVEHLFKLNVNRCQNLTKESLLSVWGRIGINPQIYDSSLSSVNGFVIRLVLLTAMNLIAKPYLLVAEPMSMDRDGLLAKQLREAASHGAAVLVTGTHDELVGNCDRIIDLH